LIDSVGDEPVDCEGFVRATASCPRLKRLTLSLPSYTMTMDAALADCPKTAADEPAHDCSLWSKLSRKIQHLRFKSEGGSDLVDPWNADMMANISMICRLNRSGRAYMEADSNNQREGFEVLGSVSEDLNCLYFHLRENPLLCGEQSTAKAKRRRDGEIGSA
jgi:hypothetical protein